MDIITIILLIVAFISLGLGIAVYMNNRSRKTNQAFLIASLCMVSWLASNVYINNSSSNSMAITGISVAFAIAACIPTLFHFLRLSICYPHSSWVSTLRHYRLHILINVFVSILCFHRLFLASVQLEISENGINTITPHHGPLYLVYNIYFIAAIAFFAFSLYRDRKTLSGSQRLELEFLGFACIAGLVVGLSCGTILAAFLKSYHSVPIAHAASVLTLTTIVAYGVSVHKILAVAVILRKIVAYALLSCYMIAVYLVTWFSLTFFIGELGIQPGIPVHILCTLVVVFSMLPVRKKMEQAAVKLIAIETTDIPSVIKASGEMFQSVTTHRALQSQFANLLLTSFSSPCVLILTLNGKNFLPAFTTHIQTPSCVIDGESALPTLIRKTREPISYDSLVRLRPNELLLGAKEQLGDLGMNIAVGVFSKSDLNAIILLSAREGGRIFDKTEQDGLQILCNQFAVALENAHLYTEMQDSKIRNEIMLDQLVSGVIVANPDRKITLFNHEAQRITGIPDTAAIGMDIGRLPRSISKALEKTLKNRTGLRNIDASLYSPEEDEEGSSIRMGSAFLFGHDDKPMGALLVFTDITELKSLEEQVRRSDQLSSVGTLAAGMAHEIKNPLVTIKTFTQLLPQRYADEDFRNDFASLVAHEVSRIDGIVNELLSFSKPTQPHLVPMDLRETVEQTLKLIHEQLSVKNISLNSRLKANKNIIMGDAKVLSQALVNLNLNAIEAIGENGTITVGTINCIYRFANGDSPEKATARKCIRLQITDTGKGIEQENMQKIFDPFFTSKSEGTGMGLSVAHGIINEHHGVVEVESEPGLGTTFYIYIPVLEEGAKT